jgi:hypothetical protein
MNMKILIMTDMEGVAGVLNHDDWVQQAGRFYSKGVSFLTEETNAAVRGFFSAGVKDVVVVDGHGAGGIDPEAIRSTGNPFLKPDLYPIAPRLRSPRLSPMPERIESQDHRATLAALRI